MIILKSIVHRMILVCDNNDDDYTHLTHKAVEWRDGKDESLT